MRKIRSRGALIGIFVLISAVLMAFCFYDYTKQTDAVFEDRLHTEVLERSDDNVKNINENVFNITERLAMLAKIYSEDVGQHNVGESITQFSDKYGFDRLEFVGVEAFPVLFDEPNGYIGRLMRNEPVIYEGIAKENGTLCAGVAAPIFDGDELIGVFVSEYEGAETQSLFTINKRENNEIFCMVTETGQCFYDNGFFTGENCLNMLEQAELYDDYTIGEIEKLMLYGIGFDLHYSLDGMVYYARFNPSGINSWYLFSAVPDSVIEYRIAASRDLAFLLGIKLILILAVLCICIIRVFIICNRAAIQNNHDLKVFTSNIPGGVAKLINDDCFSIAYANEGFYELSGYTREEYKEKFGDSALMSVYSEDRDRVVQAIRYKDIHSKNIKLEYRIIKKDGTITWVMICGNIVGDGSVFQCVFIDITANRIAAEELARAKEQIENIIDSIEGAVFSILVRGNDTRLNYANDGFYTLIGYDREEVSQIYENNPIHFIYEEDIYMVREILCDSNIEDSYELEFRIKNKQGELIWVHFNAHLFFADSEVLNYMCVLIDISDFKNAAQELQMLTNSIPGAVVKLFCADEIRLLYASDGYYSLLGYSREEYEERFGQNPILSCYGADAVDVGEEIRRYAKSRAKLVLEYRKVKKSGGYIWISLTGAYFPNEENLPIYQCILIDTTAVKNASRQLDFEKEKYKIVSDLSNEILFEYDIASDYMNMNIRYMSTFGNMPQRERFVKNIFKNGSIYKPDRRRVWEVISKVGVEITEFNIEIRVKNGAGEYVWAAFQGAVIYDDLDRPIKVIGKAANIDELKKDIEELRDKSRKDALTKIYNKTAVAEEINLFLGAEGAVGSHAFMMLDIDNFKAVNDNLGHVFGDAVLLEVTSNIKKVFSDGEILGRIGGDEFVVFIKNVLDTDEIKNKAEKLCDIFRNTYAGENSDFKISASIGIARYPDDGKSYEDLFKNADRAVYASKNMGKDCYMVFDRDMLISGNSIIKNKVADEQRERRNSNYDDVAANVVDILIGTKNSQMAIPMVMSILGKYFKISRIYIFENDFDGMLVSMSYEWCGDGVKPLIGKYQRRPLDESPFLFSMFDKEGIFYCNDTNDEKNIIDETYNPLYELFHEMGVHKCLRCAIQENGVTRGYIGFDICDNRIALSEEQLSSLIMLSKLVGSVLIKMKAETKLQFENQITRAIIHNQQIYTYIINPESYELLYVNDAASLDYAFEPHSGMSCYKTLRGRETPCERCPIKLMLPNGGMGCTQYYDKISNKWMSMTASWIKWSANYNALLICSSNITDYIEQLNYKDSLTGIDSLNKFKLWAERIVDDTSRRSNYALIYMDLDEFKYVNDNFGYSKGDELLCSFANLLYSLIEQDELLCRANDDKFILMLKYSSKDAFDRKMKRIVKKTEEMQKLYFRNINVIVIGGIYVITDEDEDLNFIIDKANIARKTAKGTHKSTYVYYSEQMHDSVIHKKEIESKMLDALANREFTVYYQPKIELSTGRIIGAEALVRWMRPDGAIVPPNDFIPVFERNGFIVNLDFFVYEEVFKQFKKWEPIIDNNFSISVNISRAHLKNSEFAGDLCRLALDYKIPAHRIELELTESIFLENTNIILATMNSLKEFGFKLSIDDFGSAYSSLNMLKNLPVDIIKLDKEFFRYDFSDNREKKIIQHIIKMVKDLNMKALCEGVETQEQAQFLIASGCDYAQGYLFSRPVNTSDFEKFVGIRQ